MNKKNTLFLMQIFCYFCLLTLLVIQLTSCKQATIHQISNTSFSRTNQEVEEVKQLISPRWPQSHKRYKTTDSRIYLANLQSSINVFERMYNNTKSAQYGTQLASKLYFRYRLLGDFNDAIKALNLINMVSLDSHANAQTYLTLASIQSGFHQFKDALNSLSKAQELGINNKGLKELENEIRYSLGSYQNLNVVLKNDEINSLTKAKYALLNNEFKQASLYYRKAMNTYKDTDPFKLSWLQLQQGIAFLRYGDMQAAKVFFTQAHQRFPEYYLVTEHLAETEYLLGNLTHAKKLYQQVITQTNNPEFYAQLAKVEALLGHNAASQKALSQAQQKFDLLTQTYPTATGDHAVQFYLDNKQKQKALFLAQTNLKNRKNIESYELLIKTAMANNNQQLACETYKQANRLNVRPLEFYQLSSELSCSNIPTTTH